MMSGVETEVVMKNRVRKTQIVVRDGGRRGVGADRSRSAADRRSRHGHRSGGLAVVVLEQPAEALVADDLAAAWRWQPRGHGRPVADALVRPVRRKGSPFAVRSRGRFMQPTTAGHGFRRAQGLCGTRTTSRFSRASAAGLRKCLTGSTAYHFSTYVTRELPGTRPICC